MIPQLPKQTIERIEREAFKYIDDKTKNAFKEGYVIRLAEYKCLVEFMTREALLVLPVLNAANTLLELSNVPEHNQDDEWYRRQKEAEEAIANYEQGTVK